MEREDVVVAVLSAAGGSLTGRVRLQKAVYLLDRLGLNSGFDFEYHHYGPYSRELDYATLDAKAFNFIEERQERRQSDGAAYSIFSLRDNASCKSEMFGTVGRDNAERWLTLFARTNVTVLELAATVDWLWRVEKYDDWRIEIARRKGVKVQGGRLEKALDLLVSLGLEPPPPPSPQPDRVA